MERKAVIYQGTKLQNQDCNVLGCSECGCLAFTCSKDRVFICDFCHATVNIAPEQIERICKLTVLLNDDEPIIDPAIRVRQKRDYQDE